MVQFLGPETDIMGERIFMKLEALLIFSIAPTLLLRAFMSELYVMLPPSSPYLGEHVFRKCQGVICNLENVGVNQMSNLCYIHGA